MSTIQATAEAASAIGRTAALTGEELIVFAAARGLTIPPGTAKLAERLGLSGETQPIASLAARILVCRGIGIDGDAPETSSSAQTRDGALEAMLLAVCEPASRVVVIAGAGLQARVAAFSCVADFTVAQVLLPRDVHVLRACAPGEVRASFAEATQVAMVPDTAASSACVEIERSKVEQIRSSNREELKAVLASVADWQSLDSGDRSSLFSVLGGEAFMVTTLFHRVVATPAGRGTIVTVNWAVTNEGVVWRLDTQVPLPGSGLEGGGGLIAVRSGRADLEARLGSASDAVGVPTAE